MIKFDWYVMVVESDAIAQSQFQNRMMDNWQEFRVEVDVVNFHAAQPVSQRRRQRWQHLQLQHNTQLPIYVEHLSLPA